MAQPEFYSDGTTPRRTDTRLRIWKKILGTYQNEVGALASNNPRSNDTLKATLKKINNALTGV